MKKQLGKIISLLLVCTLLVGLLTACGAGGDQKDADGDKKYTIGVSIQGSNNDWATASYAQFRYGFEAYEDQIENLYYVECGYDSQKQLNDIEDLLTKDVDALIIQSTSETALVGVIEKAKGMGVKVVIYGGLCGTDAYDSYIDRDHEKTGAAYAGYVCDRIGGKGNVIVINGYPGSGYSNAVLAGIDGVLANYPDVKVLGYEYAEYTPALSKQIVEAYLAKGETIDGVIVDGGLMGYGVLEAFHDAGLAIPPTSCDDTCLYLKKAVSLNFTDYICCSSAAELSYDAVELLFKVLNGEAYEKDVLLEPQTITGQEVLDTLDTSKPDSYWLFQQIPADRIADFYK